MSNFEYRCRVDLNLYDSPDCQRLATQAARGRHLRVVSQNDDKAVQVCWEHVTFVSPHPKSLSLWERDFEVLLPFSQWEKGLGDEGCFSSCKPDMLPVCLVEDDYPGWLRGEDLNQLEIAPTPYHPVDLSYAEICDRLPAVISFTTSAMQQPNYYLWGGTVGPNYDCSGLMQAAFVSQGIWLPRDAYQQEAFTQAIKIEELMPGDLVFFGTPEKATHVGLYLGDGCYIHSSGEKMGRNKIAIDPLSEQGDRVTRSYYQQLRGAGRVVECYKCAIA
jgi:NlpC/P60 family/Bacterial dipeptidyl-peptidase Sh3 domain